MMITVTKISFLAAKIIGLIIGCFGLWLIIDGIKQAGTLGILEIVPGFISFFFGSFLIIIVFLSEGKTKLIKYPLIAITFVILIFIGICVYFEYFHRAPLTQSPETKKQENVVKDETANWQTYRNKGYGFEIKYPSFLEAGELGCRISEIEDKIFIGPISLMFFDAQGLALKEWIDRKISESEEDTKEMQETLKQAGYENWQEFGSKLLSREEISIAGEKAVKLSYQFIGAGFDLPVTISLKRGGQIYDFRTNDANLVDEECAARFGKKPSEFMELMLSTFKFIETPSSTSETTVIDKISPKSGPIGTAIEIRGKNFSGFEGDLVAWIEDIDGVKGYISGDLGSNDNLIRFTLQSSYCQVDTSYSGLDCPDFLYLPPGVYKIYVSPWGIKSNEVTFTITNREKIEYGTGDWNIYKNTDYGLNFEYPKNWGAITLKSQKDNGVCAFSPQNETRTTIIYHKPSGITAFIDKGEKYALAYGGEGYQDILKVIYPDKEIKIIYTMPPDRVEWYGGIIDINFSPNGKYVYFGIFMYESYDCMMLNIDSGLNITDCNNIRYSPYGDVYWSSNNKVLAIKSEHSDFGGEGVDGLFVSDYDNPEKLNEVFSFTWEEHISGSNIYDIRFIDDYRLFFRALSKECSYGEELVCKPERITKYEYNVKTGELEKVKE